MADDVDDELREAADAIENNKEDPAEKETLGVGKCLPPFIIFFAILMAAIIQML